MRRYRGGSRARVPGGAYLVKYDDQQDEVFARLVRSVFKKKVFARLGMSEFYSPGRRGGATARSAP